MARIVDVTTTTRFKTIRVIKYIVFIVVFMFVCAFVDATVSHFISDPWFTFKNDWKFAWGAMIYRLLSTWNYERGHS